MRYQDQPEQSSPSVTADLNTLRSSSGPRVNSAIVVVMDGARDCVRVIVPGNWVGCGEGLGLERSCWTGQDKQVATSCTEE